VLVVPKAITSDVIRRAKSGRESAINEVIDQCRPSLRQEAENQINGRFPGVLDASDIVQKSCESVWKGIGRLQKETPVRLSLWLKMIVRHNVEDEVRRLNSAKHGGGRIQQQGSAVNVIPSAAASSAVLMQTQDDMESVKHAINELNPKLGRTIELRLFYGFDIPAIAAAEGVTEGQVRERLRNATNLLQSKLNDR